MISRIFITLILLGSSASLFAERPLINDKPPSSILPDLSNMSLEDALALVEAFLLKALLPLVIIGTALYIAYKLFLAEGNEEENKKAWKALTYASVGVIAIGLAYALVAIISRLQL